MRRRRFGQTRLWASARRRARLVAGALASRRACALIMVLFAVLAVGAASASAESLCTDTWVGPSEGAWETAADWSTGEVPTSVDVACVGAGKTVKISSGTHEVGVLQGEGSISLSSTLAIVNALEESSIKALTLTGTLKGAGTVSVAESLSWSGGKMEGTGSTVLQSGATGSVTGTSRLHERSFVNNGTVTVSGETWLYEEAGATFTNVGTFIANSTRIDDLEASGTTTFVNRGTFKKTGGNAKAKVFPEFYNYGTIVATYGEIVIVHPVAVVEPETEYGPLNESALFLLRAICGDPVDCVSGNFYEAQSDIAIGGRGVGLALTRYYNAQVAAAGEQGPFGYGWSSSFSDHVVYHESAKTATVVQANGSTVPFSQEGSSWNAPEWTQDKLAGSSSEGYTLTLADQKVYEFSGAGQLESVADRNGNTTSVAYNEEGQLMTITDPSGRTIKLAYNSEGLVESATDPMGHVVKYSYESKNLATVTLPGQLSPRWQFKYDSSHRMTSMVNGTGGETVNTYNSGNQVVSQKGPAGHTLKWEYEPFKTTITNEATGSVTLEEYTSADRVNAVTHGYGTEYATTEAFTYNEAGEPLSRTDGAEHATRYEYDGEGNKTRQTDPEGHETKWTYNAKREITSETLPSGEKTSIEYDEHGNPIKASRPAPKEETQETLYEYNAQGEMTAMIDSLGQTWSYGYDEAGDRTSESDPKGDKTTWGYNEDSQKTSEVAPVGNVEGAEASKYTTTIERDELGEPVKVTKPEGRETLYEYDADGNQTAVTDPNGHKTTVSYNAEDRPIKVEQPSGATQMTEYNGAGQIIKQTDGNEHATTYVRDVLGQVTEVIDPLERKTTKTYDAAGNIASVTDPEARTATYSYDKENRLTKIAYSEEGAHEVEYEYNTDGQRTSMTDGTGTTTYSYDQLGRLTGTEDGHGGTTGYAYDLGNEITKITYPNGKSVEDGYDNAGRLSSVADWLGHTIAFTYTADSELSKATFPEGSGVSDEYAYNDAGQMSETTMLKGAETLASITYSRDNLGQLTKVAQTGLPGEAAPEYGYTVNEQLETAGGTGYEYDPAGNPTKIGAAINTFNAASELTEGGGVTYAYDTLGERTSATPTSGPATSYGYSQAGNLTTVNRPEEGETAKIEDRYTYNGDNLCTSETISSSTRYLTWQTSGTLPLLLSDGTHSFIYGPEGLPVEQIATHEEKEEAEYLHHDQQGSTRLVTNEAGEAIGSYTYTPYGATATHEGTASTPLGYDGQYTTPDTGLIYLRARAYDPATAQFMNVDPVVELTRQPYTYTLDNPLNLSDPSGLCGFLEVTCYATEAGEAVATGAEEVGKAVVATGEWVGEHPTEAASIGLGVISIASGFGAIAAPLEFGELTLTSTELGIASAATGSVGAALDANKCFASGDAAACTGFSLNALGASFGMAATLIDGGFIESTPELRKFLEYAGVSAATLGLGVDVLSLQEVKELLCG
jgi:RHS repeat-associated protein